MASSTLSPSLQKLTTALSKQGLTGTEIAEVMWLSATIYKGDVIDIPARSEDRTASENPDANTGESPSEPIHSDAEEVNQGWKSDEEPPVAELVPEPVETLALPENYRPIPVPDASGITDPLEIARSLRTLAKKAEVGQPKILDEAATVKSVAETGIWHPVLRPEEELWWDVALVFDKHPSMCLWQRFAEDLRRILSRYGQFRDVRIWFVEPEGDKVRFLSRNRTVCHKPSELLTGDRRRLVVILSDCVGAGWHNGQMRELVSVWANKLPTVVFQVFPARLWTRTALARSITVEFQAKTAHSSNNTLKPTVLSAWDQTRLDATHNQADLPYLPIVPIDPQALARWAGVLAGDRRHRTLGIVWDASPTSLSNLSETELTGLSDRLDTFILRASPLARQLATLLTAAPVITLPIVRLIRRAMLPQARTVHFAEVFMSGLLKISGSDTPNFENAEKIAYELTAEEVRQRLQSGSVLETQEVLNRVSLYIAQGLGKSIQEFRALLRTPGQGETPSETQFLQAFATVTAKILRGLGGDFETISDRLIALPATTETENQSSLSFEPYEITYGEWEPDETSASLIPEELEFTVAQLVEESSPEQTNPYQDLPAITRFNYTVVTLNPDGRERERYDATTTGFIEVLGEERSFLRNIFNRGSTNKVNLEMIAIPEGEFLMGAPKNEEDSRDSEHPQHRVRVPSFYLGRYPVTQAQWRIVAGWEKVQQDLKTDPSRFKGDNLPVEKVSWDDAQEFCARLRKCFQRDYCLPSEAQWEYACRAGTTTPFHFGETLNASVANYDGNYTYGQGQKGDYRKRTVPVGSLGAANPWGLFDMHGNVWEWCEDDWHGNYEGAPEDGSAWTKKNISTNKVRRGGSWRFNPRNCRSAYRSNGSRDLRFSSLGFRVACPAPRSLAL